MRDVPYSSSLTARAMPVALPGGYGSGLDLELSAPAGPMLAALQTKLTSALGLSNSFTSRQKRELNKILVANVRTYLTGLRAVAGPTLTSEQSGRSSG